MKNSYKSCFIVLLVICYGCNDEPCDNRDSFMAAMEEVVVKAEEITNTKEFNWVDLDRDFDKYVQECYIKFKSEMDAKDRVSFYEGLIRYSEQRDNSRYKLRRIMKDAGIELDTELSDLGEQGAKELEEFFKAEIVPQLNTVLSDVLDEIEKFGNELKDELEKYENQE